MGLILAIDPGTDKGAYLLWDPAAEAVRGMGVLPNAELLALLGRVECDGVYCEMIASYGMAVGREVFETCVWIGRAWQVCAARGVLFDRVLRQPVKLHLCHSARAKDGNIRAALLDRFGAQGTKKAPGRLYGVSSHIWAALAVAVYVGDTIERV